MQPLRVTLSFLDKQWSAIDLELAPPENIQNTGNQSAIDAELKREFESFGFGTITPVRFLSVEWQIAQKIHALTHPDSDRAHDLVDLQKLWTDEVDAQTLLEACQSTFRYRQAHDWPPLPLRSMEPESARYQQAVDEVFVNDHHSDVLPQLEDAEAWLKTRLDQLLNDEDRIL
ncbi:MAG: nucleotidyl transferase AbiEii/AbiGii toxin family protein [Yaniella sp.]|nr:nucleotidyl transferase AbiEii/AbiGii toxin family protein [Yaniella sp.]